MNSHPARFEELERRLLSVEKQNRRLKQLGAAALVAVALLIVMGQAASKKTVEANEFVLRDATGRVRARLTVASPQGEYPSGVAHSYASLVLFDGLGKQRIEISSGFSDVKGHSDTGTVDIFDESGTYSKMLLGQNYLIMQTSVNGAPMTTLRPDRLQILDPEGFAANLGTGDLATPRTGETHKTSAASLVLFDKDKNVIWKAP